MAFKRVIIRRVGPLFWLLGLIEQESEMSSRKEREKFDALTSRILLFLFGFTLTAMGCFFFSVDQSIDSIFSILGYASTAIGLAIVFSSLVLDDAKTIKYAESTGNSEIMALLVLLAFFLAWSINRVKKSK